MKKNSVNDLYKFETYNALIRKTTEGIVSIIDVISYVCAVNSDESKAIWRDLQKKHSEFHAYQKCDFIDEDNAPATDYSHIKEIIEAVPLSRISADLSKNHALKILEIYLSQESVTTLAEAVFIANNNTEGLEKVRSTLRQAEENEFPAIIHTENSVGIGQRATDGYVNATALCKTCGKRFNDYARLNTTIEFIDTLCLEAGIPATGKDGLLQTVKGGLPEIQGTWVHPRVAINLGQWASPKFAVAVSKWVFDWMNGNVDNSRGLPFHIRRYMINRHKIPPTHFSMLDQMTLKLLGALESNGYRIPDKLMPDISLGKTFSQWLIDKGHDPQKFPTYDHVFDDGVRPTVKARLYPNSLMTEFNNHIDMWIKSGKALKYFEDRDKAAIEPLKKVMQELEYRRVYQIEAT
jgi:hypothetical protein